MAKRKATKKVAARVRKAARAPAPRIAVKGRAAAIEVSGSPEAVLGAAYLLTDRAYVLVDRKKSRFAVSLTPKSADASPAALARAFVDELATQEVRWQLARNNQPIREYVAEQAVLLANGQIQPPAAPAPEPAPEQLSDAQRLEIEKLIAEVEDEIKQMNDRKAVSDPKNIKASWEEKQQAAPEKP